MQFSSWGFFFLLLLLPLFHRIWRRRNRPARLNFSVPVPKSVQKRDPTWVPLVLRYLAFVFLVSALARPQAAYEPKVRKVEGVDIVVVMDVSASMNIEDLADRPRLDIAKETIEKFVEGRNNDRIGFVIFSGEPLTLSPPTLDYGLLKESIKLAKTGQLRDGTAIGDGLALAVNRLRDSKAKSKVIILLTDGENNVGQLDPMTAGELAAGYQIKTYTIAIGREGRVRLPIRGQGPFGKTVTSYQWFDNQLNPKLLKQIAKLTNGKFYRVTDESALKNVFDEIDQLEKTKIDSEEKIRYRDVFEIPLRWGLIILGLELLFSLFWVRLPI